MNRVRFAPSPTGYLHLGNVRTALFNFLFVKKTGGKFILRIEDTDKERSRDEYTQALQEDLKWLGIRWDEGPGSEGAAGSYKQSERMGIYREYLDKLIREEKAYECYVTPEEVEAMKQKAREEKRSLRFENLGRSFSREEIEKRKKAGVRPTVRFKIDEPELQIHDLIRGEVAFNLDDMVGDFVLRRADGMPTFHFAVCVDDGLMNITHVIRGEDHLSNTPKHILLMKALGFTPPAYGHLPLVLGPGGEPLSKRFSDVSVREFRRRGYLPEALANYIALLGWASGDNREIYSWAELQQAFDLGRVGKSPSQYDPQKLDWVNADHIKNMPEEHFIRVCFDYFRTQNIVLPEDEAVSKILCLYQKNISKLDELAEKFDILNDTFTYEIKEWVTSEESRKVIQCAADILESLPAREVLTYEELAQRIKTQTGAKGKGLFMPVRMAWTGKEHGRELKLIYEALGVQKILLRLKKALDFKG